MADKLTQWEKEITSVGWEIVTWDHDIIMEYLIQIFNRDKADLLLLAASDDTNRRTVTCVLDHAGLDSPLKINIGGTVTYNKKLGKFTYITYSDKHNWAVQFSIDSKVAFFARDFYKSIKKVFPFGYSTKKLKEYLCTAK